jgi:DNA modification methylase
MRPYIRLKDIDIYNNNYQDILPNLKKESIDLILTDVPYNNNKDTSFTLNPTDEEIIDAYKKDGKQKFSRSPFNFGEWNNNFDVNNYLDLALPLLSKNGSIIIFCGVSQIGDIYQNFAKNDIDYKRMLCYSKSNPIPLNTKRLYTSDLEFALYGVKKGGKWVFNRQKNTYDTSLLKTTFHSSKDVHPTMKDKKIITELVLRHSNKQDTVLDGTAGSLSICLACKITDRKCIAIEQNKEYIDKGVQFYKLKQNMFEF